MASEFMFVINSLIPGGAERSLVELLPPLRRRGITPLVVCLHEREIGFHQEVIDGGFELIYLRSSTVPGMVSEVRSLIRSRRPDLVHTSLFDADLVGRLAAWRTRVPVMTTLANTTYDPVRIEMDDNLNRIKVNAVRVVDGWTGRRLTDHFHAVSVAVKESAVEHLGLDPDAVTVVRRGRDPERLGARTEARRASARERLGLTETDRVILTVGRHEYQKGQLHLIEAFRDLLASRPDAVLMIAGREGNATGDLHARVEKAGISSRVQFLGHRTDVPDLMVAADVFAFPSLWEGLGGVLIEALALEVPIVTSDLDATREVVGDEGTSGVLFPPGDEAALASLLERVIAEPGFRRRVTSASRQRFESSFLLEDRSRDLIDLMVSVAR